MITVKTSETIGKALDWLVARLMQVEFSFEDFPLHKMGNCRYSTDFSLGGPILERAGIATRRHSNGTWIAVKSSDLGDDEAARWNQWTFKDVPKTASTSRRQRFEGPTQLIAGLRCLVAGEFGESVEFPDEFENNVLELY